MNKAIEVPDSQKFDAEKMLTTALSGVERIKLGPGVVGRNTSIACAVIAVAFVVAIGGAIMRNAYVLGGALLVATVVGLYIAQQNINFTKTNPLAALMEGAELLRAHELRMASKETPVIEVTDAVPNPLLPDSTPSPELPEKPQ